MTTLPKTLREVLRRLGLVAPGEALRAERLTGGVASDIWLVRGGAGDFCVKRALEKLRVARDWRVPTDRNAYEVAWLEIAAGIAPGAVPRVLGHDASAGVFAMEYFPPARYANWKQELRGGRVSVAVAIAVAELLGRIHSATADDTALAARFDDGRLFFQLRLEPYLHGAASLHPDLAERLVALAGEVADNRRVLVHGDVSPKNILVCGDKVVLLDAECAGYGDAAFDLAFCLNHLLLKCLWVPAAREELLAAFAALCGHYLERVTWEPRAQLAARAARLLPALLLARVDGKSPVEYLDGADRERVRDFARRHLWTPPVTLEQLAGAWVAAITYD